MRRGRGSLTLATALFLGGCLVQSRASVTDVVVGENLIEVVAENVGDGFGSLAITYLAPDNEGVLLPVNVTVVGPCPLLGPGETCNPTIAQSLTTPITRVELEASSGPNSVFQGWTVGELCTGSETECLIDFLPETGSEETVFQVSMAFDLSVEEIVFTPASGTVMVGGDLDLSAAAYADQTQTVPVGAAQFTWASSNPSVATVTPTSPGSAVTVSGVASGQAWIRATARAKTDSVLVVVQ